MPAGLLLSGVGSNSAVPEFDRAVAIVGMFETGTTTCARGVYAFKDFPPSVGCLGFQLSDLLSIMSTKTGERDLGLKGLSSQDSDLLQRLLTFRTPDPSIANDPGYRPLLARLTEQPEVWVAAQARTLGIYEAALRAARELDLRSERGVLLLFDRLVQDGTGAVSRAIPAINEAVAQMVDASELDRIAATADYFLTKRSGTPLSPLVARRINTIVSGKGSLRGVDFDLDQIGVTTKPMYSG